MTSAKLLLTPILIISLICRAGAQWVDERLYVVFPHHSTRLPARYIPLIREMAVRHIQDTSLCLYLGFYSSGCFNPHKKEWPQLQRVCKEIRKKVPELPLSRLAFYWPGDLGFDTITVEWHVKESGGVSLPPPDISR